MMARWNTHANRGRPFEELLKLASARYQIAGRGVVRKVPTEFLPIRGARGEVVSCKVEEKSCVDFLGRYYNIPVAVSFSMKRFFIVPWQFWKVARSTWAAGGPKGASAPVNGYGWFWDTPGKASVSPEELLPDWEIRAGGQFALPYLDIIEQMARGNRDGTK